MSALTLRNLTKTYANGVEALKGIDLTVERGDFFALLGPNGAGKSTTIGIVSSLVNKTDGEVIILGHSLDRERELAKQKIGVVPQEFNFSQFEKVFDIVVTQAGFYGIPAPLARERAEKYLRKLGLWDKRKNQARSLSGGMKRRLMIARALVHEPELLILDEPTAGVDIELRRSMWDFLIGLNNEGRTIILTTHYLEEAESLCRRIAIIDHGRIVENTDMKSLLEKLQVETFILDLARPVERAPELPGFEVHLRDAATLEVAVPKSQSLNRLFVALAEQDFEVMSMRNKANRLEELFVRLVEQNLPGQNPQQENAP
ncbi:MAG TPA: ABC transporter ATP-binding protein [Alcanivorax sp.]|nr:ABC transporter ATP-binding protein [Alcanivorax sp.]